MARHSGPVSDAGSKRRRKPAFPPQPRVDPGASHPRRARRRPIRDQPARCPRKRRAARCARQAENGGKRAGGARGELCRDEHLRGAEFPIERDFRGLHLERGDFLRDVKAALARAPVSRGTLRVEISETYLMDHPEHAVHVLNGLADIGTGIAIGDFGHGYSSLGYLERFPFSVIRLSRAVTRPDPSGVRPAILRSVVTLAHDLDVDEDRALAPQHARQHGDALLGEGVGGVATPAAAL